MAPRPTYRTNVVERAFPLPRTVVWHALLDLLFEAADGYAVPGSPAPHGAGSEIVFALDGASLRERTLSLEPPWRRAYEIVEGAPVAVYQGTIAIRDDGPSCLLMWEQLIEALPDGASDAFIERSARAVATAVDQLAARLADADPARRTLVVRRRVAAPPEEVWAAVLALYDRAEYELEGTPPPHGLGAVWRTGTGGWDQWSRVTAFEPPQRRAYEVFEGAPVVAASGETTVAPAAGGGSVLTWRADVEPLAGRGSDHYLDVLRGAIEASVNEVARHATARH